MFDPFDGPLPDNLSEFVFDVALGLAGYLGVSHYKSKAEDLENKFKSLDEILKEKDIHIKEKLKGFKNKEEEFSEKMQKNCLSDEAKDFLKNIG